MKYLSVCSGIEAATVAWHPLGWKPFAFAEIEKFPSAVLAHHYPSVPNLGDMTKFKDWPDAKIDLLVGGTPCQSFSVAGLRKGLDDPRGNLALTYCAILDRYRPRWFVWENVPGVLSTDGGRAFGSILGAVAELGYHASWRVLDAQYVRVDGFARAVPQRRRRVFVVGYLGDWRRAAAVLFERESLLWDSAPRRQAGQGFATDVAPSLVSSGRGTERIGETRGQDPIIAVSHDPACTLTARERKGPLPEADLSTVVAHSLRADGFDASEDGAGRETPLVPIAFQSNAGSQGGDVYEELSPTLRVQKNGGGGMPAVMTLAIRGRGDSHQLEYRDDGTANAVLTPNGGRAGIGVGAIAQGWAVRRLTPRECERLQGFPDNYTAIPKAADGPRYKALGNSMAVNAMRWLGQRIQMVEARPRLSLPLDAARREMALLPAFRALQARLAAR